MSLTPVDERICLRDMTKAPIVHAKFQQMCPKIREENSKIAVLISRDKNFWEMNS